MAQETTKHESKETENLLVPTLQTDESEYLAVATPSSDSHWKEYLKDKSYLFYCPSMKGMALEIAEKSKGSIILGDIDWTWFRDGFPNLKINDAYKLRWANVAFLADLSDPRNIFEQYSIMCSLPRYLAKSVKIFVGYFPTGKYIQKRSFFVNIIIT